MKVAALQMDIAWHEREINFDKARHFALEAKKAEAEFFILPEMFSTGFSMDARFTAEPLDGGTPAFLRSLAKETGMAVAGGFVMARPGATPQNVSLVVDQHGKDLALYAKMHLVTLLGEDKSYVPGNAPVPFDLEGIRAACFICYDLRFPEIFRKVADACDLILVMASWPASRKAHWEILLPARAVENQCYVMGVNRIGEGGGITFVGGSALIDPVGQIIARAEEGECLLIGDIDKEKVKEIRNAFPFLKDRKLQD